MRTYAANDIRPRWEPQVFMTEGRTKLVVDMLAERSIDRADMLKAFPQRPANRDEFAALLAWIKRTGELKEQATSQPTPGSTPQGALPVRTDKNGKPMCSYYAIDMDDTVKFYRVKPGRKAGFYFIDAQGSDEFYAIRNPKVKEAIIKAILAQGPEAAMQRYGQEIGKCGHCGRTLTDAESRAYGIGPICREG